VKVTSFGLFWRADEIEWAGALRVAPLCLKPQGILEYLDNLENSLFRHEDEVKARASEWQAIHAGAVCPLSQARCWKLQPSSPFDFDARAGDANGAHDELNTAPMTGID